MNTTETPVATTETTNLPVHALRNAWELYVSSWKVVSRAEKTEVLQSCLNPECVYTDPLLQTRGLTSLADYMLDFHRQVPGGHFVVTDFAAHHGRSLAKWQMRTGEDDVIGDGVSYAEYDEHGRIRAVNGFFKTP